MPKKRELKIELTGPLKINKATIKLIAEDFLDWWEKEGYKKHLADTENQSKDTGKAIKESNAKET